MNPVHRTALAFLAHPDDAEILCAGTLIRLRDAGWDVHIATATAGDCGTMDRSADEISRIRLEEARAGAAAIGGTYHCLRELDGRVCYDKPTVQKALDLFRVIAPSLVLTHAAKDYMMDHEMVSLLARAASFAYAAPNISALPRAPQSAVPWLYYCDPLGGVDPLGAPVAPSTYVDVTSTIDRKTDALAAHASQREWLRAHHGMDEYLDAMTRHGRMRGGEVGVAYAEAFVQHRGHAYPHADLLAETFGALRR
jgi:LmbE family N-acetylglucosaminyl deacetylase